MKRMEVERRARTLSDPDGDAPHELVSGFPACFLDADQPGLRIERTVTQERRHEVIQHNIAPTQEIAVIVAADSGRELNQMRWGLIPSWSKDPKSGPPLFNARSETAAEKPTFRSAMRHRRCLIPADGFYEWKKEGKQKLPIYIRRPDEQPFALAGLWERWNDVTSCTILTTAANGLMQPFHDRMPVILSPNDYDVWLDQKNADPEKLKYLFEPLPDSELIAYPVNPVVNNARHDAADCIESAT